jgi:hypothetical protein
LSPFPKSLRALFVEGSSSTGTDRFRVTADGERFLGVQSNPVDKRELLNRARFARLILFLAKLAVMASTSKRSDWTPEQIANAKRWVETWKKAGPELERLRREELRRLDPERSIELLCGPADYTVPPRAPKPTSGLVEQQRWFMKAYKRD